MTRMIRQSMTAYATPLCETVVEAPEPRGTEVLVRIHRCGVCHSDVHLQDGYFSLGGDKTSILFCSSVATDGSAMPAMLAVVASSPPLKAAVG